MGRKKNGISVLRDKNNGGFVNEHTSLKIGICLQLVLM